jgi:hypothetical protein
VLVVHPNFQLGLEFGHSAWQPSTTQQRITA